MKRYCFLIVIGAMLSASQSLAEYTATLVSVADTGVRDTTNSYGADSYMYIFGSSSMYHMGYVRFDLRSLDIHTITNAQLVMTVSGGAPRNDNLTTGRFAAYGLNNVPGNTPQNWNEATLNKSSTGLEVNWAAAGGTMDFSRLTNLDANDGAGTAESIAGGTYHAGTTMTLTGQPLIDFLQSRVDDDGLVTFIIRQRDGGGRGYGLATREHPEETYRPRLQINYVPANSPRAFNPRPENSQTIPGQNLTHLSFKGWGTDRFEVWFGPGQADETNYKSQLARIAVIDNPGRDLQVPLPQQMLPLAAPQDYTWVVESYVSDELYSATVWTFSITDRGRLMENLGRGVVATRSASDQAFISWRLLGTDPENIAFNLYRKVGAGNPVRVNSIPLTGGTNFQDSGISFTQPISYFVRPVLDGQEQQASASFTLPAGVPQCPFFLIPIRKLDNYDVNHVWVGDLNGDGEYDFIVTKMPRLAEDTILVEAYLRDGTFLWDYDCGPNSLNRDNISHGSSALCCGHGDNITVYDLDCDGKAEVIIRTANGVRFGDGAVLTHGDENQQFISVLDGMTGAEIARADVPTDLIQYGPLSGHMGIAYLDGIHPSVVWSAKNRRPDGGFEMMVCAWTLHNDVLVRDWKWIRTPLEDGPDGHNIRIADVDGDGRDEIIPFGFCLNPDGSLRWSLADHGVVHGDRFHVGKMDPTRPGLQGYLIQQDQPDGMAWAYFDAATGQILQTQYAGVADYARGMVGDLDPRFPGYEFWTFTDAIYNISGQPTSTQMPSGAYPNFRIWWTGDLLSENLDGRKFTKWQYEISELWRIYTAPWEYARELWRYTPAFYGDILGDWREEVVYESSDQNYLAVYTTQYPTEHRIYTLPHNPKYRADMTVRGYYQSHMVDFYLGDGMETPPRPKIELAGVWWNPADIIRNGRVDLDDFAVLAAQWLGVPAAPSADIAPPGGDGQVNLPDLLLMADNWLFAEEQ